MMAVEWPQGSGISGISAYTGPLQTNGNGPTWCARSRQAHHPTVCRLCPHQSTAPSGQTPEVFSVHQPRVVGTANPEHLSKALAH
jgi:hypothetical protein